jgi:uncharacterized metal-binding protein (TIGR02443 family)
MDRLRTWRDEIKEHRECVSCGYQDSMRLDGATDPEELTTRVNEPREQKLASSDEQVIKFVSNPSSKTDNKK